MYQVTLYQQQHPFFLIFVNGDMQDGLFVLRRVPPFVILIRFGFTHWKGEERVKSGLWIYKYIISVSQAYFMVAL